MGKLTDTLKAEADAARAAEAQREKRADLLHRVTYLTDQRDRYAATVSALTASLKALKAAGKVLDQVAELADQLPDTLVFPGVSSTHRTRTLPAMPGGQVLKLVLHDMVAVTRSRLTEREEERLGRAKAQLKDCERGLADLEHELTVDDMTAK